MLQGNICSQYIIKSINSLTTQIEGYASVFGNVDQHNDIIIRGAFSPSKNKSIKLLWQHDVLKPIGVVHRLLEDDFGLKIKAEINNMVLAGREASELIKQKAVDGLSIGFTIKAAEYNAKGYRVISEIELFEVSVVTFPANLEAQIHEVKGRNIDSAKAYSNDLAKLEGLTRLLIKDL